MLSRGTVVPRGGDRRGDEPGWRGGGAAARVGVEDAERGGRRAKPRSAGGAAQGQVDRLRRRDDVIVDQRDAERLRGPVAVGENERAGNVVVVLPVHRRSGGGRVVHGHRPRLAAAAIERYRGGTAR